MARILAVNFDISTCLLPRRIERPSDGRVDDTFWRKVRGNRIVCNAVLDNAKRINHWAAIVRCSGSRGKFTAVPLRLPAIVPSWLKHARERMRAAREMADFRQVAGNTYLDSAPWWKVVSTISPEKDAIWHLVVTSRHKSFAPAYALEAVHLGFHALKEDNMFGVACDAALDDLAVKWSRMVGIRFAMEPLVMAPTPTSLLTAVNGLRLRGLLGGYRLVHEKTSDLPGRIDQVVLRSQISAALRPEVDAEAQADFPASGCPLFVVVESRGGYIFGPVVFSPGKPLTTYADAPHQWSAGLPPELAGVAVNLAALPGDVLLDPCCGLGTILYEALRRNIEAIGSDSSLGILKLAAENLEHFGIRVEGNWGLTSAIQGPHNPRGLVEEEARPSSPVCDVIEETFGSQEVDQYNIQSTSREIRNIVAVEHANGGDEFDEFSRATRVSPKLVTLVLQDAREVDQEVDCIVTNLPFDRFVKVEAGCVEHILEHLKLRARRFVFFSGKTLRSTLESLGYNVVIEVRVCYKNKRYLTIATT